MRPLDPPLQEPPTLPPRTTPLRPAGRPRGRPARARSPRGLTEREREIVALVTRGLRNREIGERLAIQEGTVKVHLHNIFKKLGVQTRLALARLVVTGDRI